MNPEIQKALEAGKISEATAAALENLSEGTCIVHKSWGFGKIAKHDFDFNQVVINFTAKPGHAMQFQYAAESLKPLAPDHILARIAEDASQVRAEATKDPVQFTARILAQNNNRITQDEFTKLLVPAAFKEPEFKKWWDDTKKLLKKDGHFSIPTKKSEPIVYRSEAVSHSEQHLAAFQQARQVKDQISALEKILRSLDEITDHAAQVQPVISDVEDSARRNLKLRTAECLTLISLRDELVERGKNLQAGTDALTLAAILLEEQRNLTALLEEIPAAKVKRALNALQEAFGEEWSAKALALIERGSTRLVSESARLMQEHQRTDELRTALDRAIRNHSISSAALTWLCDKKERSRKESPFRDLLHPRVMSAMLSALERDQFNENRDRKLHDLIINDMELMPDLLSGAELEEVREAMRKLLLTPVFEDLNKRSLLGRFVRVFPELEALISGERSESSSGEREEKQEGLIVSWESLQKRQEEYEDLINKKIPENSRDINEAASHGDLKENAEFKAAKEMQRMLGRRRSDLEREIMIARGTDFANPDTAQVSIGTSVTVKDASTNQTETYHILGAWDSDLEKGIISYKTAVAQALIGHKIGDTVSLASDSGERPMEIVGIDAWNKN
jgi:transcription elongation factor GreA